MSDFKKLGFLKSRASLAVPAGRFQLLTSLLEGKAESRPEQVRAVPAESLAVFGQLPVPELRGLVPAYLPPSRIAEVMNWKWH